MQAHHRRHPIRAMRQEDPEAVIAARAAALRRLVAEIERPSRSNPDDSGTPCKEKGRHAKHSGPIKPSLDFRPRGN